MEELDLDVTSEFLLMAATLLEIKSKMLLPKEKKIEGKQLELDEIDPRIELVQRLLEYKKYKHVSEELQDYEQIQRKVYYKPKEDISFIGQDEDEEIEEMDLEKLVQALNQLIKKNKNPNITINMEEIQKEEYTLDDSMEKIKLELEKQKDIKFSTLFENRSNKKEIVVVFLSILELIRLKYIIITQEDNFSEIIINKRS